MEKEQCSICCENYNKSTRKKIECHSCNLNACKTCWETHFIGSAREPSCMGFKCSRVFSVVFIVNTFGKSFYFSKLKKTISDFLFAREKALIPDTLSIAENVKKRNEIFREIDTISKELEQIHMIKKKIKEENKSVRVTTDRKKKEALKKEYSLYEEYYDLMNVKRSQLKIMLGIVEVIRKPRKFIINCSNNDCKGFIENDHYCKLCETHTCENCHLNIGKKKDGKHTCDKNDVLSVNSIIKETKPCPKCNRAIYRIHGCDHMFCTVCFTSFHWVTLELIGNSSNPHYLAWRNSGGNIPREAGDVICGGVPILNHKFNCHSDISNFQLKVSHIRTVAMENINGVLNGERERLERLRVKYILGEFSEKEWLNTLFLDHKRNTFNRELYLIYDMFCNSGIYILNNMLYDPKNIGKRAENIDIYSQEMTELCDYCTIELQKLYSVFGYRFNNKNIEHNLRGDPNSYVW